MKNEEPRTKNQEPNSPTQEPREEGQAAYGSLTRKRRRASLARFGSREATAANSLGRQPKETGRDSRLEPRSGGRKWHSQTCRRFAAQRHFAGCQPWADAQGYLLALLRNSRNETSRSATSKLAARVLMGKSFLGCCVALAIGLFACSNSALAQEPKEDVPPPKYNEMVLPSGEDLLRGKPFDWIVLRTEDVLVVEPTSPRPDPVGRLTLRHKQAEVVYLRTLKYRPARTAEADQLLQRDRGADADKVRAAVEEPLAAARNRMQDSNTALQKLAVTLLDDSVDPDYVLDTRFIQRIVHYEDFVLRRVEQLIVEGRVSLAYDLMLLVGRRHRDNNARIREELEDDEATIVSNIAVLTTRRQELRDEREALRKLPVSKRTAGAKKRESDIDNSIESFTKESKEWEEDLVAIRKKLRFARPKDFPKPDPLQKDDILFPSWPKFDETYVKLILKDAEQQAARNDLDGAWRLLEEIWKPGGVVIGLSAQMGSVVDRLVGPLVERQDYRQARHYLNRLAALEPEQVTVQKWRGTLIGQANTALGEARAAASRGEASAAVQSIERAARLWPEAPGLKEAHRELTDRHQSVRVGVLRVANTAASGPFPTAAEERARLLMTQTLFEPTRIAEQGVRYRSSYFEAWEPADLGREIKFTLKLRRADWESRGLVTSADVQSELAARLDPHRPSFDERLAGFVAGISVQSPSEFTVRFHRLPLRLESLWQFPVGVQRESLSLNEDLLPSDLPDAVSTSARSAKIGAGITGVADAASVGSDAGSIRHERTLIYTPPSERGIDEPADATRPDSIAPAVSMPPAKDSVRNNSPLSSLPSAGRAGEGGGLSGRFATRPPSLTLPAEGREQDGKPGSCFAPNPKPDFRDAHLGSVCGASRCS